MKPVRSTDVATEVDDMLVEYADDVMAKPQVFGQLVRLCGDTVQHYHGDFYHDVMWMEQHVPKGVARGGSYTFYFGCRDTGTSIGEDLALTAYGNDKVWRVFIDNRDKSGNSRFWAHRVTIIRLRIEP